MGQSQNPCIPKHFQTPTTVSVQISCHQCMLHPVYRKNCFDVKIESNNCCFV